VLAAFEGIGYGGSQLALLGPRLEARQNGGKWTGGTEERLHEWAQRLERPPAIIGEHLFRIYVRPGGGCENPQQLAAPFSDGFPKNDALCEFLRGSLLTHVRRGP
jgi:hypothetical protein